MSKEEKKAPVKAIAKTEVAVKTYKTCSQLNILPAKHVPAVHVLTTFDDLMENFRKTS